MQGIIITRGDELVQLYKEKEQRKESYDILSWIFTRTERRRADIFLSVDE